jgi:hypothetical protein
MGRHLDELDGQEIMYVTFFARRAERCDVAGCE